MFFLLTFHNLRSGGVPGGVLDSELQLLTCNLLSTGIHTKQRLLGLGPKFIPPQLSHGGVRGGVHADDSLLGEGMDRLAEAFEDDVVGGEDGGEAITLCGG